VVRAFTMLQSGQSSRNIAIELASSTDRSPVRDGAERLNRSLSGCYWTWKVCVSVRSAHCSSIWVSLGEPLSAKTIWAERPHVLHPHARWRTAR